LQLISQLLITNVFISFFGRGLGKEEKEEQKYVVGNTFIILFQREISRGLRVRHVDQRTHEGYFAYLLPT